MPRTVLSDRVEYRNSAGFLHRDGDLPAVELNSGGKQWWVEGQLHRLDNPAFIFSDGNKAWWLNGCNYSKSEYYSHLYLYKGILSNVT